VTGLVTSEPTTRWAVQHIVANLRERDRAEIYALRWDNDEGELVKTLMALANPIWRVFHWRDTPAAIVSVLPVRPGVALVGAFGTDEFDRVAPAILRYGRREVIYYLREMCVHRCEAYALAGHVTGRRFIQALGGQPEAVLHEFGRDREDFVLYVWRIGDVLRRWGIEQQRDPIPVLHEQQGRDGGGRAGLATSGDRPRLLH
jgi:hypothetical protein